MAETYTLELINIRKSFPGVVALKDVTLRARPGEVHALVGENGAGKSTLLKIMFGIEKPDSGDILLDGKPIVPDNPSHAQHLGISLVHQELQQIPELSVAQNIFLARELTYPGNFFVNRGNSEKQAAELLQRIGIKLNVKAPIKSYSIAERQMVEIAKALMGNTRVIAFDEPTSSLTPVETEKLFAVIRDLKAQGVAIIYVSHRLEEIMTIADRVTVLRDGQLVGEAPIQDVDQAAIVRMMINRDSMEDRLDQALFAIPNPSRAYRIGAVVKYLGNPYWRQLAKGMETEANKYGLNLTVRAADSETNPVGQLAVTAELLASGCDALLFSPQTDLNLMPAIEKARAAGVVLVNVHDAVIPNAEHFVGANQYDTGALAAGYFTRVLPAGGKVAVIEGQPGVYATEQRTRGFVDTLPGSRFSVVARVPGNWDRDQARQAAETLLKQHPDLAGFYCNNDTMALGAMDAIKAAGQLGNVIAMGTDGISDAYESIRAGELAGTIDSLPEQTGQIAMRVAIALLEQQKAPQSVYTPQNLVTLNNIDYPASSPYPNGDQASAAGAGSKPGLALAHTDLRTAAMPPTRAEEVLRVVNIHNRKLKGASFALYKGELLGISGLVGSGRTELMRAIYGADPAEGEIYVSGQKVTIRSPQDAIAHGIGFLPEDRKLSGLLRLLSLKINITLPSLPGMDKLGMLNKGAMASASQEYVKALDIQPPFLDRPVMTLSGGNQQKTILARWLLVNSDILIFDEPTRGIDVGAKNEIYHLMENLVRQGKSIIMVSSELPEILRMSQRILVMREGEIVKELPRSLADQEIIMHYATGAYRL